MEYNCKSGEYFVDAVISVYGDFGRLGELLNLNRSVDLDSDLFGTTLQFDALTNRVKPVFVQDVTEPTTAIYNSRELQSVYDICLQLTGGLSRLAEFITGNIDEKIPVNTAFTYSISENAISSYFSDRKIIIQSDFEPSIFIGGDRRLLESLGFRLLEDGSFRILE